MSCGIFRVLRFLGLFRLIEGLRGTPVVEDVVDDDRVTFFRFKVCLGLLKIRGVTSG